MIDAWPSIAFFQISAAAVLLAAAFAYKYSTQHYGKWKRLGVPHTEPTPGFGHFGDFLMGRRPAVELIDSLYRLFDGQRCFGVYEGRRPVLVVRDAELLHSVMVSDFAHFYDRVASNFSYEHDKLFEHLINLRGERWKAIRSKLSPTFSAAKLKSMLADIHECMARLMDNLNAQIANNDGIVDVGETSAQYTIDTIGRCAFGLDCNALTDPNSEFRRAGRDVFTITFRTKLQNFIRLLGLGRVLDIFRARRLPNHIYDFIDNLVETTMEQHKNGASNRKDFISLLVKIKDEDNLDYDGQKLLTDDILAANVFVFFVAGFETTASTLSYCLYDLAMNPKIQDELREKIKRTRDANEGKLSYDTLQEMKYLDMVINESLRLHPPVPVLERVCTKKYTLPNSNITLDVGDKLKIPVYSVHHDPRYYSNPEVYDPERFTEENKASRQHGTFFPFGDGPRICIGMRFAIMEIKTGLAEIISKFEVKVCKETQNPIKIRPRAFLLLPTESIRLSLTRIQ